MFYVLHRIISFFPNKMVVIPRKVVVPDQPRKHAKDYMHMCTIIATVEAVLPCKHTVMLGKLTYIH